METGKVLLFEARIAASREPGSGAFAEMTDYILWHVTKSHPPEISLGKQFQADPEAGVLGVGHGRAGAERHFAQFPV